MNYEEKYNEILEWARKNKARLNGVPIEEVLPELAESEDERIRKAIVSLVYESQGTYKSFAGIDLNDMVAWLEKQKELTTDDIYSAAHECIYGEEKQKEQKPAEWSEEDERMIGRIRSVVNECASYNDALDVNGDYCEGDYAKLDAWLKSLRN